MLTKVNFAEAEIATAHGKFNFRAYEEAQGKETVVLWTDELDITKPVLVRVHSECLTGDIFSSLKCDCGKQLQKSLDLIQEHGGVLIYLRQEGRGIGLFEKIKTYQLQSQGHDTFEANVLLGHPPDARSYEMVKKVLDDLGIDQIRLLTNNPSKVSEIAKSGIHVVERVPLLIKPNLHNKRYFETKRSKFQHQFTSKSHSYFYQFHADTIEEVQEIAGFLEGKKRDPLLNICLGTDKPSLAIFQACESNGIIPIFHASFLEVANILAHIEKIKRDYPHVKRLHLNDLQEIKTAHIKKACELFEKVDLPLTDDHFDIIHNRDFRNLIKKRDVTLLIDNSKGRGIKESVESFKSKINLLLSYGIQNIALCGGFGPDSLNEYFELRRFYKINFSIDAESKLKTSGKTDLEKIKLYLTQLIRFDDPKHQGVTQTRKILQKSRRNGSEKVTIQGKEFIIHEKVFHPGIFPSTSWFATTINKHIKHPCNFCEVGCGSGVISCLTALAHPRTTITATDINPHATSCTHQNAQLLGLTDQITTHTGDVLDALEKDAKFDYIFWALPFGFLDPGINLDFEEHQVFDSGYRATRKFFQTAKLYLKKNGKLLLGFSSDLGNLELLYELANESRIKLNRIASTIMREDEDIKFELIEGIPSSEN